MALYRLVLDSKVRGGDVVFEEKDSDWVESIGGKPLLSRYKPRKAVIFGAGKRELYLTGGTPMVTEKAWKALQPLLGAHVELLPIVVKGQWFVLNVLTRKDDALDRAKSPNDRITVHAAKVPPVPIFGIGRGHNVQTIVDDSVKNALQGFKGWAFEAVGGAPRGGAAQKAAPAKPEPVARVEGDADAVKAAWKSIEASAAKTKTSLGLAKGASDAAIAKLEKTLGVPLPEEVVASLKIHDGQKDGAEPLFGDGALLSCAGIASEWKIWKEIVDRGDFEGLTSEPAKGVRDVLWSTRWIPMTGDGAGNHVCVDLDPTPKGKAGQLITVWSDEPDRELVAAGWAAWLAAIAKKLAKR